MIILIWKWNVFTTLEILVNIALFFDNIFRLVLSPPFYLVYCESFFSKQKQNKTKIYEILFWVYVWWRWKVKTKRCGGTLFGWWEMRALRHQKKSLTCLQRAITLPFLHNPLTGPPSKPQLPSNPSNYFYIYIYITNYTLHSWNLNIF